MGVVQVAPNAVFTFTDYTLEATGITMHFVCQNPGPGMDSDYTVFLTDAEITGTATLADLKNLVTTKLTRLTRATTLTNKLNNLIGQSITIA